MDLHRPMPLGFLSVVWPALVMGILSVKPREQTKEILTTRRRDRAAGDRERERKEELPIALREGITEVRRNRSEGNKRETIKWLERTEARIGTIERRELVTHSH